MTAARRTAAARAALFAFCAFTSVYCLMCSIPFVWTNLIRDDAFPLWVGWLRAGHGGLALAVALFAAFGLSGRARAAWGVPAAAAAAAAAATGWLAGRDAGGASLSWAFAAWVPYLSWETLAEGAPRAEPAPRRPAPAPTLASAVLCASAYAVAAAPRGCAGAAASAWSAVLHMQLFLLAALVVDTGDRLADSAADPAWTRVRFRRALAWACATAALTRIQSSFAFTGPAAWSYSALASAAAVAFVVRSPDLSSTLVGAAGATAPRRVATVLALFAFPWAARAAIGGFDWNRLFESVCAVACWSAAAAFFHAARTSSAEDARRRRALWSAAACVALLAWGAQAAARHWAAPLRLRQADLGAAVLRLESDDVSLSTVRRILHRSGESEDFLSLLQEHTNLPRTPGRGVRPLDLSSFRGPGLARKPNIFVFVVDSLRPDYLGAYEPRASFTPAIDAFARDAVVFRHAFTAYGGTGLSEPSIWSGARLPHMQYPSPFPPMDTLEKLVDHEGYRALITRDTILAELLKPDKAPRELDRETYGNYKLCRTLQEVEGRLDAELASGAPLFVYTQPQDVHISVIQREGARPLPGITTPEGFHAPYATRVAALDRCFGRFIAGLKTRGLYDDSVIVLSSDHGDSLGEGGRWGHAYTLFPEVLRVPLIVKAPRRLLEGRTWDPDAAAFLTDLTPSLYSLLGREPETAQEPYGRTLFARSGEAFAAQTRAERMVVSSYGPVYGVLYGAGQGLILFDGVNRETHVFDLAQDPRGESPRIDFAAEERARVFVRASLAALRVFYGY